MLMIKKLVFTLVLLLGLQAAAKASNVFEYTIEQPMGQVYDRLYKGLEKERYWVVFEANIGKNIARFEQKWGEDYNQNKLDGIRSMVFCNPWYANAVSNADPKMLALCPLRLSLIEKNARTTVLFARPTVIAAGSPARNLLQQIEDEIIAIIRQSSSAN